MSELGNSHLVGLYIVGNPDHGPIAFWTGHAWTFDKSLAARFPDPKGAAVCAERLTKTFNDSATHAASGLTVRSFGNR